MKQTRYSLFALSAFATLALGGLFFSGCSGDDGEPTGCEDNATPSSSPAPGYDDCGNPLPENPDHDWDGDGTDETHGDCDDTDPLINPAAVEYRDGRDNNCNGITDSDADKTDNDGDGFSEDQRDCNDADAAIFTGADELCNGKDDDCNGQVDEEFDRDNDDFTTCGGDCNDSRADIHPGVGEYYDDQDNDCNGHVDDVDCDDVDGDGNSACYNSDYPYYFDCNDLDKEMSETGVETCDGKDNDCDGTTDEELNGSADVDGDGFTTCTGDCDDTNSAVNPKAIEKCNGIDDDCDGFKDEGADVDGDKVTSCGGDCNDADPRIYAGATESANGIDDDCDGTVDEDLDSGDGDGDGFSEATGDCDDKNKAIFPGATETCNKVDDDCDGKIDNGFDVDGDKYTSCGGDCDDNNDAVNPAAVEIPDGLDNNCNGEIDDGLSSVDGDGDGYTQAGGDCDDTNPGVHPGASETCNSKDDNCDGTADEGVSSTYYIDTDHDSFGDPAVSTTGCAAPSGYANNSTDCNDEDEAINPNASEICNGVDDNCDGTGDPTVNGLFFLENTDTVTVPDSSLLDMSSTGTVEFWINWSGTPGQVTNKWKKGSEDKAVAVNSSGTVTGYFLTSTGSMTVTSSTAIQRNVWTHVAVSWGGKLQVYINGQLGGESTIVGDPKDSDAVFNIGGIFRDSTQYGSATGTIADVRISSNNRYTAPFTPAQSLEVDSTTLALWRLNDGSGSVATDSGSGGLNGTITGAAWTQVGCR